MKIKVTAEDITRGVRQAPCGCPVALAVERATGRFATVSLAYIRVDGPTGLTRYDVPAEARDFIRSFDLGGDVQPFDFDLEAIL